MSAWDAVNRIVKLTIYNGLLQANLSTNYNEINASSPCIVF
jgi:hypothetical protein